MGFRGLSVGVSGLKSQAQKMDVIGNNLANINTTGFKKDRVNFQDVYYQSIQYASQGDGANVGGTNSQEIGLGVQIGSIDTMFNQGSKTSTSRTLDFMIEGDDFFVAKNSASSEIMLSRNGAFQLDGDMYLVDSMGNKIQGFNVDRETLAVDAAAGNIQVQTGSLSANATSTVNLSDNIDSSSVETSASTTTNAWEVFSGGENFGSMNTAILGLSGTRTSYGSGYYQDSYQYVDSSATLDAGLTDITLSVSPTNLVEGFTVGDSISILQGSVQVQRTISAINTGTRTLTVSTALPATFNTANTATVHNITDGTSFRGTSGSSEIHSDILRSQVAMVDANGNLLASFQRVSSDPAEYTRSTATVSGGASTVTIGTGEFNSISQLKELMERTLNDTQLSNYSSSSDLDISVDKYGKVSFSGTGLVSSFLLVMNADNTEMLDRFSGIAITDASSTATTQARVDSSGQIIATSATALASSRTSNESKNWFDTSGLENYGFSTTSPATEYGEFAGLKLDGGADGNAYGTLQLSLVNGLGNTVLQEFKLVARSADSSEYEFTTMGELAQLVQNTLRSSNFSSLAEDGSLVSDSTATVSFSDGRMQISTSNGNFNNLTLRPANLTADTSNGISRTDDDNFGTVLGQLSSGFSGKQGISNEFIQADIRSQTRVYDSQGNEHTAISYFVKDRSSGLDNIEWKFQNSLQPNVNTFAEADSNNQSVYRNTFNSVQDNASSRGVLAFDLNTGAVLSNTSTGGDSRYLSSSTLTFTAQENSVAAATSSITVDFSSLTSFNGDHTIVGSNTDGYAAGSLVRIASEQNTGEITGVYSNGQIRTLARIGLMHIDNPEGMEKIGTSYFSQTSNSNNGGSIKGLDSVFTVVGADGVTTDSIDSRIHGSHLEASNVDVTEELTEMIIAQRSYSASGKTITTNDDMIQEALSLKR